ncbi:hypothetical protein BD560DRAFT_391682 [Blakeslea trispora]|nr:hypothetical protein BD560DRAFT_391682 [Blakeslea trispora]
MHKYSAVKPVSSSSSQPPSLQHPTHTHINLSAANNPPPASLAPAPLPPLPDQYKVHKYNQLYYMSRRYVQSFQQFFMNEYAGYKASADKFNNVYQEVFNRFTTEALATFNLESTQERQIEATLGYPNALIDHFFARKHDVLLKAIQEMKRYMEQEMISYVAELQRARLQKNQEMEEQRIQRDYQDKLTKLLSDQEAERKALAEEQLAARAKAKDQFARLMPPSYPLPLPPTPSQTGNVATNQPMQYLAGYPKKQ